MTESNYKKVFKSNLLSIKDISKEILDYIKNIVPQVDGEDLFDLRLILNELLVNAVIHGNKNVENKHISIELEIKEGPIIIGTITDEGSGFNYRPFLKKHTYQKDDCLVESGRGITIVHSLSDKISFNAQGNTIQFYKRMSSHG